MHLANRSATSPSYLSPMRYGIVLMAVLMPVLLLAQGQTRQEKKVRSQLERGKAYPAIRVASGMLGKGNHPEFYALRAEGYNNIAEHTKAEADARMAIRLLPDSVAGLYQLALAEQGLGQLDSAAVHLREVLQRSANLEARYRLAMVEQMRKHLPEAMQEIDRAIAFEGGTSAASARLHRVKGEIAAMMGDSGMARKELDQAIQLAPSDPVNYNSRGYYAYAWNGDHIGAIADYDRAIKLNPNYSYAFNNRGWSYYKSGNTDRGIRDIDRARRKKVHNPFVYRNLGVIALETGDTTKACMLLRQALDKGFTGLYGSEVNELIATSCKGSPDATPKAPVQPAKGPVDRKTDQPVPRSNAPE